MRGPGRCPIRSGYPGAASAADVAVPRLEYPTYLDHIRTESARFRAVLTDCDPSARVPDLPRLGRRRPALAPRRGAAVLGQGHPAPPGLAGRPEIGEEPPPSDPSRTPSCSTAFDDVLRRAGRPSSTAADPDEPRPGTGRATDRVGTSYRRQAHEALIHRLDAEQTAGAAVTPLDPALAADGVAEVLGRDVRRRAAVGHVHAVRRDDRRAHDRHRRPTCWSSSGSSPAPTPTAARPTRTRTTSTSSTTGAEPVATVTGTAADLDTWLWKRDPALTLGWDEGDRIRIDGDRIAYEKLLGDPGPAAQLSPGPGRHGGMTPAPYRAADDRYEAHAYRRCGRSGLKLPAVSLGLWHNFGDDKPIETQRAILRRAFDLGVTHFDLANNYGPPYGAAETQLRHDLRPGLPAATATSW